VSHNKVGDALADQGSLDEALASYGASLAIFERLAADRSHAGWQSDLSVAYERISTVLRSKSYIDEALARYRKSLATARGWRPKILRQCRKHWPSSATDGRSWPRALTGGQTQRSGTRNLASFDRYIAVLEKETQAAQQ